MKHAAWQNVFTQTLRLKLKTALLHLPDLASTGVFLWCFERKNGLSNFSSGRSKYSGTSLHNHYQNTLKPRFMTIAVFR